jgi:uncharacterized membrane protein YphA (DoxX/SURF4 family)
MRCLISGSLLGLYVLAGLFTRVSAWATNALTLLFFVALLQEPRAVWR